MRNLFQVVLNGSLLRGALRLAAFDFPDLRHVGGNALGVLALAGAVTTFRFRDVVVLCHGSFLSSFFVMNWSNAYVLLDLEALFAPRVMMNTIHEARLNTFHCKGKDLAMM